MYILMHSQTELLQADFVYTSSAVCNSADEYILLGFMIKWIEDIVRYGPPAGPRRHHVP
jgi:hypothetical protein